MMNSHFTSIYSSRLKSFFFRFLTVFIVYSFVRLFFVLLNSHQYTGFKFSQILDAFFLGLRFDLSALALLNLPLFLFCLVSGHFISARWFDRISHWAFLALNVPFLFLNVADFEYYKFTGSHMTVDVFLLRGEAAAQIDQFIINFWHLIVIGLLLAAPLFYVSLKIKSADRSPFFKKRDIGFLLVLIVLIGVGARGGMQKKPLKPTHAFVLGHDELGSLALNSTFTILKSKVATSIQKVDYYDSFDAALERIPEPNFSGVRIKKKDNVVILILESFATEFWGAANPYDGFTPFLDRLSKKGLFFKKSFANGRRSIEGLPAVLWGVPSLMSTPIANSNYQQSNWIGLGHILQEDGYHTSFFHGAAKGTMYFDSISARGGLSDYYPLERYPMVDEHFDGNWGLYDEPFLKYMVSEISRHPQPFFSLVFTISTHQPYHVPEIYSGKFKKGTMKIHESVRYVDYAVEQFFKEAEKQPWFKNTLFIITADHTQMSESEFYNMPLGRFMVPVLIYHPGIDWDKSERLSAPVDTERIVQQTDILPTVIDFVGAPIPAKGLLRFGRSIFDQKNAGEAILHQNGNYWLVKDRHFLQYTPGVEQALLFDLGADLDQKNPLAGDDFKPLREAYIKKTQAYIQYFQNGLIDRKLYVPLKE